LFIHGAKRLEREADHTSLSEPNLKMGGAKPLIQLHDVQRNVSILC